MATVNFSVPDDVKDAFNRTFEGRNKSALIAALMREAVEREQRRQRSSAAIDRLLARRDERPVRTTTQLLASRRRGRP